MVRKERIPKVGLNKGAWSKKENEMLINYIKANGEGKWRKLAQQSGIKKGNMTEAEHDLIVRMHKLLGNRWSLIAGRIPGRTDNEIKNYWNTVIRKRIKTSEKKHDFEASLVVSDKSEVANVSCKNDDVSGQLHAKDYSDSMFKCFDEGMVSTPIFNEVEFEALFDFDFSAIDECFSL